MAHVTPQGVQTRSLTEWRDYLLEQFRLALGEDEALGVTSPYYQIAAVQAAAFQEDDAAIFDMGQALGVNGATGVQLDDLASLFDVRRAASTYSVVQLTFSGDEGTEIPVALQVSAPNSTVLWFVREAATISNGIATTSASPADSGPVQAPPQTLTRLVTPRAGITAVNNYNAAIPGAITEQDLPLRSRYNNEIGKYANTTIEAITAALYLAGCQYARVFHNPTDVQAVIGGVTFPAHSVGALVRGKTDEEVAIAISKSKPTGIPTTGTLNVFLGEQGTIKFFRVVPVAITISMDLTLGVNFPADGILRIHHNLVNYFAGTFQTLIGQFDTAGVGPGEPLNESRLSTPINAVPGMTYSNLVVREKASGSVLRTPTLYEQFTLDADDITITVP